MRGELPRHTVRCCTLTCRGFQQIANAEQLHFTSKFNVIESEVLHVQQPWIARFAIILLDRLLDPGVLRC